MAAPPLWQEFTRAAVAKLRGDLAQLARCAGLLSDEQAWSRPNSHCNSVANLLLHLNGNVSQWIGGGIGGDAVSRDRPAEFAARGVRPVKPLVEALRQTVDRACEIIAGLDEPVLAQRRTIQQYEVSALEAVFHVVEHFSFHTGQIIQITKTLLDVDLSLYDPQGRPLRRDNGGQPR